MQNFSKFLKLLGIVAVIVCVGLIFGWLASRGTPDRNPPPSQPGPGPVVETPTSSSPSVRNATHPQPATVPTNNPPGHGIVEGSPAAPVPANVLTNWEDKLDEILGSEGEDTNKVKELFEMFPRLPEDGQVEIAQHLSNLVEDEDYAPLGKLLENPKLPEDVLDILMADLLNRPNATKLPMFLELAKTPDHAKAEEAKDLLELYLDEDYGTDWAKWDQEMKKWLKDNPD